jgi:Mor family transcriptional regulator
MEEIKEIKQYQSIYQEIFDNFGLEIMQYMFKHYRGQSLSFPIKLINPEWIKIQIIADYEKGLTVKALAKKYEYTEQRIRIIINSISD